MEGYLSNQYNQTIKYLPLLTGGLINPIIEKHQEENSTHEPEPFISLQPYFYKNKINNVHPCQKFKLLSGSHEYQSIK